MLLVRPATQPITQDELLTWFHYRNEIATLRQRMQALERDLAARLQAGCSVDPGPHLAQLEQDRLGGARLKIR